MNKAEFTKAVKLAETRRDNDIPMSDLSILDGCALPDFTPVVCTIEVIADFIRWQCGFIFGGGWDQDELQNIYWLGRRRKFTIVG